MKANHILLSTFLFSLCFQWSFADQTIRYTCETSGFEAANKNRQSFSMALTSDKNTGIRNVTSIQFNRGSTDLQLLRDTSPSILQELGYFRIYSLDLEFQNHDKPNIMNASLKVPKDTRGDLEILRDSPIELRYDDSKRSEKLFYIYCAVQIQ